MTLLELQKHLVSGPIFVYASGQSREQSSRLTTVNGLSLSVQASKYHYCDPRDDFGPYTAVEVGFPSRKIPKLMEYAESPDTPTDTVYGHVPIELVLEIINENGGVYPMLPAPEVLNEEGV